MSAKDSNQNKRQEHAMSARIQARKKMNPQKGDLGTSQAQKYDEDRRIRGVRGLKNSWDRRRDHLPVKG